MKLRDNVGVENLDLCLYCKGVDFSYLFSAPDRFNKTDELFSVVRCKKCGLVFQNPRVAESSISKYYLENLGYYQPSVSTDKSKFKSILERQILINYLKYKKLGNGNLCLKYLLAPIKGKVLSKMIPSYVEGGRILEIGCSHGANMAVLKSLGWSVVGIETDKSSVEYAKSLGLDVRLARVEDVSFPAEEFDAVCAGMVFEHVYDPFRTINQLTEYLKSGGQLVFSIPYFEGLEFKWFKQYSYSLHLPHHISFLNKQIIKEFLTKSGYNDITFIFHSFDRDLVSSAEYRFSENKNILDRIISSNKVVRWFVVKPFIYLLSILGLTSRVTVRATKK